MLDLNGELGVLIDELQRAEVEFATVGSLASSLETGAGVQRSIDLVVWPEDRHAAEAAVRGLAFLDMGSVKTAQAGRYRVRRLVKMSGSDLLALNLVVPVSLITAMGLVACRTIRWNDRSVKVAARVTAYDPRLSPTARELAGAFALFWPDHDTWSERDLFPRFDALVEEPDGATAADVDALLVGLRSRCPLPWRWERIVCMLEALPDALLAQSPALAAFARAVQASDRPGHDVRCYFRLTPAGFEWA